MPFPPGSPGDAGPDRSYLLNCPFEEKDEAKELGAKWDATAGCWYVPSGQPLEPFNKWHPNGRKYLVCSYSEKDDAKRAGARWDASCKQWYFEATNSKLESDLARWLPSSMSNWNAMPAEDYRLPARSTKPKVRAKKSEIAMIPRINSDMTIPQLRAECLARDPSMKGLYTKNKTWLLGHLKIGTPWISADDAAAKPKASVKRESPNEPKQHHSSKKLKIEQNFSFYYQSPGYHDNNDNYDYHDNNDYYDNYDSFDY